MPNSSSATHSCSESQPALPAALLGTQTHDMRWLFTMNETGSVISSPTLTPVPMACEWFVGLTTVHNQLYSVIDFSLFHGGQPVNLNKARLMLLGNVCQTQTALLFEQITGIQAGRQFHSAEQQPDAPWVQACWQDRDNNLWRQVDLQALIVHPRFLAAATNLGAT